MSLRVYAGEFLVSPVALHLDMNWCSHACFYCFANLAQPKRRLDASFLRPLIRALSRPEGEDDPHVQWLARRGYPVLASNTVDPFAASNWQQFIEIHDALSDVGVRFTYQTKGGRPEAISRMIDGPPTMVYVSLTSDDESRIKRQEPGAPSHGERMDLIRAAKAAGHMVVAGVNPLVPGWWRDTDRLISDLADAGVRHAWVQPLHLSRHHVAAMPAATQSRHERAVRYGMTRVKPDAVEIGSICRDMQAGGLMVFGDADSPLNFWDDYFALGNPFWPTLTGWFARLEKQGGGKPVEFTQADLTAWCDVGLPSPKAVYKELVQPFARSVRLLEDKRNEPWRGAHHKPKTMAGVIAAYWQIFDYPTKLRHPNIAVAGTWEDGKPVAYTDAQGAWVFVYVPAGSDAELFDVDAVETVTYDASV